jgi:hypothetical protein
METASEVEIHLNALFTELDQNLGLSISTKTARDTATAHPVDRAKEFPEISQVDSAAARQQLYDAQKQLSENTSTSWDLTRTKASAQHIAESGESELHRGAKTCSEVSPRLSQSEFYVLCCIVKSLYILWPSRRLSIA